MRRQPWESCSGGLRREPWGGGALPDSAWECFGRALDRGAGGGRSGIAGDWGGGGFSGSAASEAGKKALLWRWCPARLCLRRLLLQRLLLLLLLAEGRRYPSCGRLPRLLRHAWLLLLRTLLLLLLPLGLLLTLRLLLLTNVGLRRLSGLPRRARLRRRLLRLRLWTRVGRWCSRIRRRSSSVLWAMR